MRTGPPTTERERELIGQLRRLVARRASEEVAIRERNDARTSEAARRYNEQRANATAAFEREHAALINAYKEAREAVYSEYESKGFALLQQEEQLQQSTANVLEQYVEDSKTLYEHRIQQIEATFREREVLPGVELAKFKKHCDHVAHDIRCVIAETQKTVRRRCAWPEGVGQPPVDSPGFAPPKYLERVAGALQRARAKSQQIAQLPLARFVEDGWPILIFIFAALVTAYPFWLLFGSQNWMAAIGACLATALAASAGVTFAVRPIARGQTLRLVPEFQEAVDQANADLRTAVAAAEEEAARKHRKLVKRRDKALRNAKAELDESCQAQAETRQAKLEQYSAQLVARRRMIEQVNERRLEEVEATYPQQIERLEDDFERQVTDLAATYRQKRRSLQEQFERESVQLEADWATGLDQFRAGVADINEFAQQQFVPWDQIDPKSWQPPPREAASLPAVAIGRFNLSAEPGVADIANEVGATSLPALLSYPDCPSLLLEAEGEGRLEANRVLQNVMLRLLTNFPPGKVRFTIIDPVGLGQNFSAFMHLADYDERLVTNRIWTESAHINQRLADLTEHMENVIQKYLRNEFASIQQYNEQAGEVAEPFQILVVANFPANFPEEAARRLVSIASSGARCGVYTLLSVDRSLGLPRNFSLADLEAHAATFVWDSDQKQFRFKHDDLRTLPLALETPPDDDRFTDLVCAVGRLAKDSARVEVPFSAVLPSDNAWWTADSRSEVAVPLGRAGAKKLQSLRLGKGTSQHVLIAGKTGSGKSTLLNAMITNLAVHYSPDELEFYLIDFKKGVEFKAYAAHRLPHARVIAIESEREFGMSVLERLDLELKRRGDLFRQHGVQDLKGYRQAQPDAVMPRTLLVIDEFQEFFTTDDRISHDSALLLDRLVRQGRAFGIHVLLGSQTLAGAYTLARSTLGQMAVRIALQCSESDAHLILSEDNTAARLLSRPGEAIYNDANGLFEGNHPFQVVWLSDRDREAYLRRIAQFADARGITTPPPIVFEGNAPADPQDNPLLRAALQTGSPAGRTLAPRAWLGSAVAIKDPTEVVFRRQGGSNLLIVGQQETMAAGILASCVVSLASQLGRVVPAEADGSASSTLRHFYVLDGAHAESPEAGFWRRMANELPLDIEVATPRDAAAVVRTIADEIQRRSSSPDASAEPVFLVVHNLARFRDLKKGDDYNFGSFSDDETSGVDKQFTTILREGPSVGVHTLVWADSFSNANRWLDRQTLRDLEMRVLFQMSATDSSNLMDSPAASRLGAHLAILYSEEQGQSEKFRPYGLPTQEWLAQVSQQLGPRTIVPEAPQDETVLR